MNILSLTIEEVEDFVRAGMMRPENINHYRICEELKSGKTRNEVADKYNVADISTIKYIIRKKCPDCKRG